MATNLKLVSRLESKIERAEQHIYDLASFWNDFKIDAYPYSIEDDAKSRHRIYKLRYAKPIRADVSWMVGDAVHNLVSALDHIAYHLVHMHTKGKGPFSNVYFPIAKTPDHFLFKLTRTSIHESKGGREVKRLRDDAIEEIKKIEPYECGKGAIISYIHQLDIIDKHHTLLAVGSSNPSYTMPPREIANYRSTFGIGPSDMTPAEASSAFLTSNIKPIFPLKTGDELHRVPFADVDENMQFTFEIAFGEPEIVKGYPIIQTLHRAAHLIREIVRDFDGNGLFT